MHPAYTDLERYIDAADLHDERARAAAAHAADQLHTALTELRTILRWPIEVLRSGTAGTDDEPAAVADLRSAGTIITIRAERHHTFFWVAGTQVTPTDLAARLGPPARRWPLRRNR